MKKGCLDGFLRNGIRHNRILHYEEADTCKVVSSIVMIYEDVFTVLASAEYRENMAET